MTSNNQAIAPAIKRSRPIVLYISGTFLVLLTICAVVGPWIAPHDPYIQELRQSLQTPSAQHWLGTDDQGRDILSRLLYSLRIGFYAAFLSVGIGVVLGVPIGAIMGYCRGKLDWLGMRVVDAALCIPPIVLILVLVSVLGRGLTNAMLALGFLFVFPYLKLVRGEMMALRKTLFAQAARTTGIGHVAIVMRHLVPSIFPAIIVQTGLMLPVAFLVEATLSYLGLSVQPPEASFGAMLRSAQDVALIAPWQVLPAGLLLVMISLALNLTADALNDILNPRPNAISLLRTATGKLPERVNTNINPLLKVTDLSLSVHQDSVNTPIAVHNVSFSVSSGEIVAIVGESGSGKTLTAMSAIGLLPGPIRVAGGSVYINDSNVVGAKPSHLRGLRAHEVGVIFQDPLSSLDPSQTIAHQLCMPLIRQRGMNRISARRYILNLMEEVGVSEPELRLRQYPHELSGGLAQRIMIALALSREPKLLIADEPTSALDVSVQKQILDVLKKLCAKKNMGILLITHSMGVVRYAADRVLVMYAGTVVEEGPASILNSPQHPYTAALLAAIPRNEPGQRPLPLVEGRVPQPGDAIAGCPFAPRCQHADDICSKPVQVTVSGPRKLSCIHPLGQAI